MTIAFDHTRATTAASPVVRLFRAIRARLTAFHHHRFVEYVEPNDPFASMSSRDRWDLPVWRPAQSDD